jgi:hypothetical protein
MDSEWSTVVTTLKMSMARVAVLEKYGQKVGFCIFPISIRRDKVMYISLTVRGPPCHSESKEKQHSS